MPEQLFNPEVYRKTYGMVKTFVTKRSGSQDDVKDILQEGFYIFFQKAQNKELDLRVKIESYVFGICKNLWLQEICSRQGKAFTDTFEEIEHIVDESVAEKICREHLMDILLRNIRKLSQKCQEVFDLRMEGMSCEQIAKEMGMKSDQISRNKAFTCKQRLLDLIYCNPEFILLFGGAN